VNVQIPCLVGTVQHVDVRPSGSVNFSLTVQGVTEDGTANKAAAQQLLDLCACDAHPQVLITNMYRGKTDHKLITGMA